MEGDVNARPVVTYYCDRDYAVELVSEGRVFERIERFSQAEAESYTRGVNCIRGRVTARVAAHPISRASSRAMSMSRSS